MPARDDTSMLFPPLDSVGVAEFDVEAVVKRLLEGVTVVMPTASAAEHLRALADARAMAEGQKVWEVRAPLTWSSWTGGLWNALVLEGLETRTLLNSLQERALWAETIAQHEARGSSRTTRAAGRQDLAVLAASAFALVEAYLLPNPLRAYTEDTRAFAAWLELFRARCDRLSVLPAASVEAGLAAHLRRAGSRLIPDVIDFVGFVELTPARRELLNALRSAGTEIREGQVRSGGRANATVRQLPTPDSEMRYIAAAIRDLAVSRLREGETLRVAVLAPDPEVERAEIDGIFRELLTPPLRECQPGLAEPVWSFGVGPELGLQPATREALDLLRGLVEPLPPDRVTALLLSHGLGEPGFRQVRARLDAQVLRRRPSLHPELTLAQAERRLTRQRQILGPPEATAWLSRVLREFDGRVDDPERQRSFTENGDLAHVLLAAAGWRSPESVGEAWGRAVDQLATLDLLGRRLSFRAFLGELERVCRSVRLEERRARGQVEVRVLRLAEAEGTAFDAVFALRSTDAGLGAKARAHPLLPWETQRTSNLPGAHAERDAERLRAQLGALLNGAGEVRFTSAAADADGPLRPSPLPEEMGAVRVNDAGSAELEVAVELVAVADNLALPRVPEDTEQRSGAQVLQFQAACPFRAFAHFRLGAEPLERPVLGLEARHAGELVHTALELFWKAHKTRDRLEEMTVSERDGAVEVAVGETLEALLKRRPGLFDAQAETAEWDDAYLQLHRERLQALTGLWLEQELRRGGFTVQPPEADDRIKVGPLLLHIRPDRVDLTADGGAVFIDYKTGSTAGPKGWEGERPDEPQMPLYALRAESEPEALRAVALARFRVGEGKMRWEGLQAEEGVLPGTKEVVSLTDRLPEWRGTLDRLAWQFAEGPPAVDPKEYPKTCQYCSQRILCRFDPAEAAEDEDGEGKSDA